MFENLDGEELLVTIADTEIKGVIVSAWKEALKNAHSTNNRDRSRSLVYALATKLADLYQDNDEDIRVFWKDRCRDRDFEIGELLFDVAVCQCGKTKSFHKGVSLPFISRCLWLVESELQTNNSRAIIVDLSKLVMGSSEKKIFVAGLPNFRGDREKKRIDNVLEMCKEPALHCGEQLYFCFVPHPAIWDDPDVGEYEPSVWRLKGDCWIPAPEANLAIRPPCP